MSDALCRFVCFVLMSGGKLEFSIIQGNVTERKTKPSLLLAFLSLMHAAICMYIAHIEMHSLERFLKSQSTIYPLSFSFTLVHITSSQTAQNLLLNHSTAILSDLSLSLLFFPFSFCLKYINKLCHSFLLFHAFLACLISLSSFAPLIVSCFFFIIIISSLKSMTVI